MQRQGRTEQDFRENGRQRSAEERGIDVRCKGLALESCVEIDTEYDKSHVQDVFPEQAEPEDQEQARNGCSAYRGCLKVIDGDRHQGQQARIHEGCAEATEADLVGDERIPGSQDGDQAAKYDRRRVDNQTEQYERQRKQRNNQKQLFAGIDHGFDRIVVAVVTHVSRPFACMVRYPAR